MALEIERKFLLKNEQWRHAVTSTSRYRQGYMAINDSCAVRVRIEGESAKLNIKNATLDIVRTEFEYPIPLDDAEHMLEQLCGHRIVEKHRHFVDVDGQLWEIDEFDGDNRGLIVAEIELDSADQQFLKPEWLGREVSGDPRFFNSYLSEHPYRSWQSGVLDTK